MTSKTMEAKCREYLRLKAVAKEANDAAEALLKAIKAEAGGVTAAWGRYYASFTEQTAAKLAYTPAKIAELFPDTFAALGGHIETRTAFKGVFPVK